MKRWHVGVVAALFGIGLVVALVPGPARSNAPKSAPPGVALRSQARAAFVKYMSSHQPLVRNSMAKVADGSTTSLPSVNWSGYADVEAASQTVSSVSGSWVIPRVQCPTGTYRNQDAFIAQWVGVDGAINGTVEQLGSATQCYEGVTYYYVWYEMFPQGMVEEGTQACINNNVDCPRPGDRITASVNVTPAGDGVNNNYTLSLTDSTTRGNNFTVSAQCAIATCLDQSAEWIIERPAFALPFGFQILPLVNFFQTGFSDGAVTSGGSATTIGGFTGGSVYDVQMSDDSGGYYLDCIGQRGPFAQLLLTSSPTSCPIVSPTNGGSFSATWDSSF